MSNKSYLENVDVWYDTALMAPRDQYINWLELALWMQMIEGDKKNWFDLFHDFLRIKGLIRAGNISLPNLSLAKKRFPSSDTEQSIRLTKFPEKITNHDLERALVCFGFVEKIEDSPSENSLPVKLATMKLHYHIPQYIPVPNGLAKVWYSDQPDPSRQDIVATPEQKEVDSAEAEKVFHKHPHVMPPLEDMYIPGIQEGKIRALSKAEKYESNKESRSDNCMVSGEAFTNHCKYLQMKDVEEKYIIEKILDEVKPFQELLARNYEESTKKKEKECQKKVNEGPNKILINRNNRQWKSYRDNSTFYITGMTPLEVIQKHGTTFTNEENDGEN